jgi:glycosyltransferase involved in cell wall biosynthesis
MKKHVVHILCAFDYGGAERFVYDLVKFGNHEKFSFSVITVVGGGPLQPAFEQLNVPIHVLHKRGRLGIGVIFEIRKILKERPVDIVHTHQFAGAAWGRLAAILAGVPEIYTTEVNINRDEGWIKKRVKQILSHWNKKIVAISRAVYEDTRRAEHVPKKKLMIISNGIDLEKFWGEPRIPNATAPTIGVVARFYPQKGHETLLAAWPKILSVIPAARLKLVGRGPLESQFKTVVQKKDLEASVEFIGGAADVTAFYRSCDLIVLPSHWEGQGIVLLEAMAAGRAIVASDVDGIREVITTGATGVLVPPKDPDTLAAAIVDVLRNPQETREMIERAQVAVKQYEIRSIVQQYEQLYEDHSRQ